MTPDQIIIYSAALFDSFFLLYCWYIGADHLIPIGGALFFCEKTVVQEIK